MMRIIKTMMLCSLAIAFTSQVSAQGNNGRGKCMQPFGISFYAVKAGYEDEWLALYMKWHYPLMEYALEHGTLLEHKLLVPDGHGIEAQWSFAASFLYPAAQGRASAPLDRAEQIQELFGERMDDYVAGEKRRWELTLSHWDTDFIELDKSESPLSVYLPSRGGCHS
ncbi:MAG: hypothetical protein E2O53_06655 [Gammaproteobacteria bacterium]|nr:MAG: hypothetical protein E2O53_06655 [Gammaproteobacteria bacterium]